MIITDDLVAKELLTSFKVIKVHYEPYAESVWTLQFENHQPIDYFDKCFRTQEEDLKLVSKMIRAQIDLQVDDEDIALVADLEEQQKAFYCDENDDYCFATGLYFEDTKEINSKFSDPSSESCIHSLFKMRVSKRLDKEPFNLKKGDWVRVKTSERNIIIDRKYLLVD